MSRTRPLSVPAGCFRFPSRPRRFRHRPPLIRLRTALRVIRFSVRSSNSSTALTVNPVVGSFTLTVSLIGTGSGAVFDNFQQISCSETAGVVTGTCSASYTAGTVVNLTASATQPSTFAGWMGACTGAGACSVTMNSSQAVTASFAPPPQIITLPFPVGTNVTEMATYDCPSNPNPTPANPCLDPNAHAIALGVAQVNTAVHA